jgi:hypothetical protein
MNEQMEAIIKEINRLNPEVLSEAGYMDPEGYLNRAYAFLNVIPEGKIYSVENLAEVENIELFTNVVCLYMCEVPGNTVSFIRDDMKQFRKN